MRRTNVLGSRVVAVSLVLSCCATVGLASVINVANSGFDEDSLAGNPDGYALATPAGWIATGVGFGYQLGSNDSIPAMSGENFGFLSPGGTMSKCGLGQRIADIIPEVGQSITVNVYQGHRLDYQSSETQEFHIQVWRGEIGGAGTLVGDSGNLGNATPGQWSLRFYSYQLSTGDVSSGQDFYFNLYNPSTGGTTPQVQLENVSASYSGAMVPEPASLLMLVVGTLGLTVYAWRKRA